jgi:trigger factor
MKIERKDLEKSIVELIIEVPTGDVAKFRKKAVKHLIENADIKGFRKGHVSEEVIVKNYGEEYISQMTVDFAIDKVYRDALTQENLYPVAQGEIKEIISQSPMKIKMAVEVFPEITIEDSYKKITLKKKEVKVSAAEIKSALSDIETKFTSFKEVTTKTSKVAANDKVTINTQGFDSEGKELPNTKMEEYPLAMGQGVLVPGFEDWIEWHKIGDAFSIDIEFPADYHNEDFAGLKTKFDVEILKIEKAVKPEFTEEFIEQLRGKKLDLAGFKDLIKTELSDVKESNLRMEEEWELIEELLKVSKMDLGDKLLEEQIKKVFEEIKQNMAQDNVVMKDYLESLKMDEEKYKEINVKPVALKRLQWELILNKVAELEPKKAEVTDKQIEKEINQIKKAYQNSEVLERLTAMYEKNTNHYNELKTRIGFKNVIESFYTK